MENPAPLVPRVAGGLSPYATKLMNPSGEMPLPGSGQRQCVAPFAQLTFSTTILKLDTRAPGFTALGKQSCGLLAQSTSPDMGTSVQSASVRGVPKPRSAMLSVIARAPISSGPPTRPSLGPCLNVSSTVTVSPGPPAALLTITCAHDVGSGHGSTAWATRACRAPTDPARGGSDDASARGSVGAPFPLVSLRVATGWVSARSSWIRIPRAI